jgi:amidase
MESGQRVTMDREPNRLSLVESAEAIRAGKLTSQRLVRACLDRIEAREGSIKAWASVDPENVLRQAHACDSGKASGALRGVPVGIKDVLNTFDHPTQMGSPIYSGHQTRNDASCVALLRAAGAIILGKTITCEFAGTFPNVTANPLALERTPGGSSSGSAAAVADFMTPLAVGTQTGGSVLRPASFCGLVGFKPTYGTFNREGLKFAAESIDTIGLIARSVEDVSCVTSVLTGRHDYVGTPLDHSPRIAVCKTHLWPLAQSETQECLDLSAAKARAAGANIVEIDLPDYFPELTAARGIINDVERARSLAWEWAHHREQLSETLQKTMVSGFAIDDADYCSALALVARARADIASILKPFDIVLAPCVNGEAPVGLHYAGDPSFQALWTLLHLPSITIPAHRGPNRMPVGLQLVAGAGHDDKLLAVGLWMQQVAKIGLDAR